jgi:hypothetical protein
LKTIEVSQLVSASVLASALTQLLVTTTRSKIYPRSPKSPELPRRIKIERAFAEYGTRVVVKVIHFNNRKFEGVVSHDDAKYQISNQSNSS